jgi:DHA1 family tetracycline resistance protein-like MFS transporter
MTRRVDPTEQGRLQGAIASIGAIAAMAAPLLFTRSLAASVEHAALPAGLPFLLAAAILAGALAIAAATTRGMATASP